MDRGYARITPCNYLAAEAYYADQMLDRGYARITPCNKVRDEVQAGVVQLDRGYARITLCNPGDLQHFSDDYAERARRLWRLRCGWRGFLRKPGGGLVQECGLRIEEGRGEPTVFVPAKKWSSALVGAELCAKGRTSFLRCAGHTLGRHATLSHRPGGTSSVMRERAETPSRPREGAPGP